MHSNLRNYPDKLVCIHQPDFFPWMGFFDKVIRSDIFVILDHVQFPKTGGTYCNRVKLMLDGQEKWVTAPVDRNFNGYRAITEVDFKIEIPWKKKILKSIYGSYCKAPFFEEGLQIFEPLISNPENNVSIYNTHAILTIAEYLNVPNTKFVKSSQLAHQGAATELLVSLTRSVGGRCYLAGSGAAGYQEDAIFADANIGVIHREYKHPVYSQFSGQNFKSGLSIIDAFMHCGLIGVQSMLNDGVVTN